MLLPILWYVVILTHGTNTCVHSLVGVTITGDFTKYRDSKTIAILSRYWSHYRDTIAMVWMHLALSLALSNDLAWSFDNVGAVVGAVKWPCWCLRRVWSIMFAVLSLYFNVTWHTLHAARFLLRISSLFQLIRPKCFRTAAFPFTFWPSQMRLPFCKIYPSDQTANYERLSVVDLVGCATC